VLLTVGGYDIFTIFATDLLKEFGSELFTENQISGFITQSGIFRKSGKRLVSRNWF